MHKFQEQCGRCSTKMLEKAGWCPMDEFLLLFLLPRSPARSLGFTILVEIFAYVSVFLIQPLRYSHSIFMDGGRWVCFCCQH